MSDDEHWFDEADHEVTEEEVREEIELARSYKRPQNELNKLLEDAICLEFCDTKAELVREIVELGADVEARFYEGRTALAYAAEGELDVVKVLVDECGASVHTIDDNGVSPLLIAAYRSNLPIFEFLLSHGASPLGVDEQSNSILQMSTLIDIKLAALAAAPQLVDVGPAQSVLTSLATDAALLPWLQSFVAAHGPSLDLDSAISTACSKCNVPAVSFLLTQPNVRLSDSTLCAASRQSVELVTMLMAAGVELRGSLALCSAIDAHQLEVVELLLRSGIDTSVADPDEGSPLSIAILRAFWSMPSTLYAAAPGLKIFDGLAIFDVLVPFCDFTKESTPPLLRVVRDRQHCYDVVEDGVAHMLRVLLAAGADPRAQFRGEQPLLHDACAANLSAEVVQLLFEAAPELLEREDAAGCRPIHSVCSSSDDTYRLDVLCFLLDKGADWRVQAKGQTPAQMLAAARRLSGFMLLVDRGLSVSNDVGDQMLQLACEDGDLDAVQRLVNAGARVDQRFHRGVTPLMTAVKSGNHTTVRCLLRLGADASGLDGQMLFQDAVNSDRWRVVAALVAHGVPVPTVAPPGPSVKMQILLMLLDCGVIETAPDAVAWNAFLGELRGLGLAIVNRQALEICIALAELPALLTLNIVDEACPLALVLPMHVKWALVTKVKHFGA